jgi:1,4-alpha-glucan branching enzyme/maltooligosyltrehalose trehalohydrolase
VLLCGEGSGYYLDYAADPLRHLARCLSEGFAYQGEPSAYRKRQPRGEASAQLPPLAFVSFLQNHDQVGNRAFGERLVSLAPPEALRAATALLLLAPSPPLLFMGEEWGCGQPFPFFCDFGPELAEAVIRGRRREFARFPEFADPAALERIPDPMAAQTFRQAVLDWEACGQSRHQAWLELYRELLALRRREIVPRLKHMAGHQATYTLLDERALSVQWDLDDGSRLFLLANLGDESVAVVVREADFSHTLYTTHTKWLTPIDVETLPPWSVIWSLGSKDFVP